MNFDVSLCSRKGGSHKFNIDIIHLNEKELLISEAIET